MHRRLFALAALLTIPSVAVAQRGGGTRTAADRHDELFKDDKPKGPTLRAGDIQDKNPLKFLVDKRKDLKLTDAQISAFKDGEKQLNEKNAPAMHAIDSLVHAMQPSGDMGDAQQAQIGAARSSLMNVLQTVHDNNDAAAATAIGTLDPDQQTKAKELLAGLKDDMQKMMAQKLGAGSRS